MNPTQDLDWLAFRYVAGELSADEAADFELLLADDQLARDAVVAAVDLSQIIVAAESLAPTIASGTASNSQWSGFLWFALGAAACWLLVLGVSFTRSPHGKTSVSLELADAWSQQFEQPVALQPEVALEEEDVADESRSEEVVLDEGHDLLDDAAAPGWMVEAVQALHAGEPAEGPLELRQEQEG